MIFFLNLRFVQWIFCIVINQRGDKQITWGVNKVKRCTQKVTHVHKGGRCTPSLTFTTLFSMVERATVCPVNKPVNQKILVALHSAGWLVGLRESAST